MANLDNRDFIRIEYIPLDEAVTKEKVEVFKNRSLQKMADIFNKKYPNSGVLGNEDISSRKIEGIEYIEEFAEKLLSIGARNYPSLMGRQPFNLNKYVDILFRVVDENMRVYDNFLHGILLSTQDISQYIQILYYYDTAIKFNLIKPLPPGNYDILPITKLLNDNDGYIQNKINEIISKAEGANPKSDIVTKAEEWFKNTNDIFVESLYNDGVIQIVRPNNKESYIKLGYGTKWCTSIPNLQSGVLQTRGIKLQDIRSSEDLISYVSDSCYSYPESYIVLYEGKAKYQIDIDSNQFMDVENNNQITGRFYDIIESTDKILYLVCNMILNVTGSSSEFMENHDGATWNFKALILKEIGEISNVLSPKIKEIYINRPYLLQEYQFKTEMRDNTPELRTALKSINLVTPLDVVSLDLVFKSILRIAQSPSRDLNWVMTNASPDQQKIIKNALKVLNDSDRAEKILDSVRNSLNHWYGNN